MLDQNTDRMWYVIGAVIVGAALIFLMNKTMPELFASVADTFEEKVYDVSELVDSISADVETDGINLIPNSELEILPGKQWSARRAAAGEAFGTFDSDGYIIRHADLYDIVEANGINETYTLTFDLKSADVSETNKMLVYIYGGAKGKNPKYKLVSEHIRATTEYKTYTITGFSPSLNTEDNPSTIVNHAYLTFSGGKGTTNHPTVKNLRFEKEINKK